MVQPDWVDMASDGSCCCDSWGWPKWLLAGDHHMERSSCLCCVLLLPCFFDVPSSLPGNPREALGGQLVSTLLVVWGLVSDLLMLLAEIAGLVGEMAMFHRCVGG